MAIILDGSTGISSVGTLTGVTSISSAAASTSVVMQDSGSNSNTCRAWVNFNGTGTPSIRASFNVSSITDNGTGDYTVNFTTAMPDVNYATVGSSNGDAGGIFAVKASIYSTTQVRVNTYFATYNLEDSTIVYVSVFR